MNRFRQARCLGDFGSPCACQAFKRFSPWTTLVRLLVPWRVVEANRWRSVPKDWTLAEAWRLLTHG